MSNIVLNSENAIPELSKSVEEFVELGRLDDMTYNKFAILAEITGQRVNINFPEHNVIYDYMKEIKDCCVTLEFTDEDLVKYRYNPKLLSYHIYGTVELYFVILAVNGMCSFKDFNKKRIKVLYKRDIIRLMEQIYAAESAYIKNNRTKLQFNDSDVLITLK